MRGVLTLWVAAALSLGRDRTHTHAHGADLRDVLSLLQQMLERFTAQTAADQQAWDQYAAWSDQQQQDKQAFLQEQQSVVSVNSAQQHASEAIVQSLTEALTLLRQEVSQTTTSIAELERMREGEHSEFEKQLRDLESTIEAVNRGIDILEGHYGAAGLAEVRSGIAKAMQLAALHTEVVTPDQRSLLARVAQDPNYLSSEYKDRDFSGSTNQAGGSSVVSTLTRLRDGMLDAKRDAVAKENEARRQFEEAKETKDHDLARSREEIAVKTDGLAESKATGEMAAAAVTQAELDIQEANAALATLVREQKHSQEVYNERARTRAAEVTATQGAVEALQSVGGISTLQTGESRRNLLQVTSPALVLVARRLRNLGDRDHSAALIEAATAVQRLRRVGAKGNYNPEATNPVKDLLRQLIQRLEDEASAETSHQEWCTKEKTTAQEAKDQRESTISALEQEIPRLETANSILTREIDFAKATLERVADETAAASAVRATNNEEFTRAREDHQQVLSALDQALQALGSVRFSFLQVEKQSPFAVASEASSAGGAVRLLQDLRNRYAAALSDLETEEQQQLTAFEELKQSNEVFRRATEQTLRSKEAERRQKTQRKAEAEQELVGARKDLKQVTKYLEDLRPSCDDIRSTFEERQRRRQAEIEALQAALAALESSP